MHAVGSVILEGLLNADGGGYQGRKISDGIGNIFNLQFDHYPDTHFFTSIYLLSILQQSPQILKVAVDEADIPLR